MKKKTRLEFYYDIRHENTIAMSAENAKAVEDFISSHSGEKIRCTYEVVKDMKSYEQLKFYWGVVVRALCQASGVASRDEMDAICRNEFMKEIKPGGPSGSYVRIPSLKIGANEVDRVKMSQYIDDCLNLLADLGGTIGEDDIKNYYIAMEDK